MIRDKEIEALESQVKNYQHLYAKVLEENEKLKDEMENVKRQCDLKIRQAKADLGILERTIDIYVQRLREERAK